MGFSVLDCSCRRHFYTTDQEFGKVEIVYVGKIGEHLRLDNRNLPRAVEHLYRSLLKKIEDLSVSAGRTVHTSLPVPTA